MWILMDKRAFRKVLTISARNGLAQEIAEADTLDLFKSKLAH